MSVLHMPKPDLLAGSGDCSGIHPDYYGIKKRTYRKTKTEDQVNKFVDFPQNVSDNSPKNVIRRSQTFTEIELNKNKIVSSPIRPTSKLEMTETTNIDDDKKIIETLKGNELARKVYSHFLLNVWRKKESQIKMHLDVIGYLEKEVNQLKLQVQFLRNLRENECVRRTNAMMELKKLSSELEAKTSECEKAQQETEAYTILSKNLEITTKKQKADLETAINEITNYQNNLIDLRQQLNDKNETICNLNNTIEGLTHRIKNMENIITQQDLNVKRFCEIAEDLDQRLIDQTTQLKTTTREKEEIQEKLNSNEAKMQEMSEELSESKKRTIKLQKKVECLNRRLQSLEDTNLALKLRCIDLRATALKTKQSLTKVVNRPWWKTPVGCIYKVASIMLPALPGDLIGDDD